MIISPTGKQLNSGAPNWMVTSQIVGNDTTTGTTRVITRKLNQVVKNPPSMSSMCVKQTLIAQPAKKLRNSKMFKSSFMQS